LNDTQNVEWNLPHSHKTEVFPPSVLNFYLKPIPRKIRVKILREASLLLSLTTPPKISKDVVILLKSIFYKDIKDIEDITGLNFECWREW